jgi:hypothetical protein
MIIIVVVMKVSIGSGLHYLFTLLLVSHDHVTLKFVPLMEFCWYKGMSNSTQAQRLVEEEIPFKIAKSLIIIVRGSDETRNLELLCWRGQRQFNGRTDLLQRLNPFTNLHCDKNQKLKMSQKKISGCKILRMVIMKPVVFPGCNAV